MGTTVSIRRNELPDQLKDLQLLPPVDIQQLEQLGILPGYQKNLEAVRLFLETNTPLTQIEAVTSIERKQLHRLLQRMLEPAADGRVQGLRALVPNLRVQPYRRKAPANASVWGRPAGAMGQLFEKYPLLRKWLEGQVKAKHRRLKDGEVRRVYAKSSVIHAGFLKKCRELGVMPDEYPFNQLLLGYRSFQTLISGMSKTAGEEEAHDGQEFLEEEGRQEEFGKVALAVTPYSLVQCDAHKIDVRATIVWTDAYGIDHHSEIERVWVIAFTSKLCKAALGYSLCTRTEYGAEDFAQALSNAVGIQPKVEINIPDLEIRHGGGFPNSTFPHLAFQKWGWLHFDEALAHLARDTLERLTCLLGTWTIAGRLGVPNDRAYQERFFGLLESSGLHNIPGTLGSNPKDKVRKLGDVGSDLRRLIRLDELEQLIYVLMANLNAEPQSGLGGRSAMEVMSYFCNRKDFLGDQLPISRRSETYLLQRSRTVVVRGGTDKNWVHINFCNITYTSNILRRRKELVGEKLTLYYVTKDIRHVKAFFSDGTELGVLIAKAPWNKTAHSIEMRRGIFRLIRLGKISSHEGSDPVEAYINLKREEAKKSRKSASALARANATAKEKEHKHYSSEDADSGAESASILEEQQVNKLGQFRESSTKAQGKGASRKQEAGDQKRIAGDCVELEIKPTEVTVGGGITF